MSAEPIERSETFAVGDTAHLKLSNIRGQVDIQAGASGVIAITARQHTSGRGTRVELSQAADGTVSAHTRHEPSLLGWLAHFGQRRSDRVDYTVRVPPHCSVELSIVEGQAQVSGLTGDLDAHTVSGDLRLADLNGRLRTHTVSGHVFGERLTAHGSAHFNAVSGDLLLVDSTLPALTAATVSGNLSLQTRLAEGPYHFNSVSGDIYLSLPAGTRCAASMHSLSGRVHRSAAHPGGQGRPLTVSLHSVSGDLWLLSPDDLAAAPAAPAVAAQPPASPDRSAVLERVARGELSVADAVSALKAP